MNRQTDGQGETSIPLFQLNWSEGYDYIACQIWPTRLHISCALTKSPRLKTSSSSTNSWDFKHSKPFENYHEYNWVFRLIFKITIWCSPEILRASIWTILYHIIINIKNVHKYFSLCRKISYDGKHRTYPKYEVLTSSKQQGSTQDQYFRIKTLQGMEWFSRKQTSFHASFL